MWTPVCGSVKFSLEEIDHIHEEIFRMGIECSWVFVFKMILRNDCQILRKQSR